MKVGHVAVWTEDMQKSIDFYKLLGGKEGLKAQLPMDGGTWTKDLCHMVFDGEATVELVAPSDSSKMPGMVGRVEHFCFDVEDVDAVFEYLKSKGITSFDREKPSTAGIFGGVKLIFLEGPSGEMIELLQYLAK